MGAQFGPLHRDRAIYVAHSVTFLPEQFHTACQQELGVGSFEFVRGVGKVQADVTQGRSTQQGVADRVQYHIPVRMGDAAFRMLDFYPAEDQGQPFAEGVYVVAVADSEFIIPELILWWNVPDRTRAFLFYSSVRSVLH